MRVKTSTLVMLLIVFTWGMVGIALVIIDGIVNSPAGTERLDVSGSHHYNNNWQERPYEPETAR
jgi:hypothetical protein